MPSPLRERQLALREFGIVLNFAAPHRIIDPSDPQRTTEHGNAWIVALQHRHQIREAFGDWDFMVSRLALLTEDVDSRFSRSLTSHAEATHDCLSEGSSR